MPIATIALIIAALSFVACIVALVRLRKTDARLARFFLGKKAADLEEAFVHLAEEIGTLKAARDRLREEMDDAHRKLRKSVRRIDTLRFNSFAESGSNQSFSVSFLDEEGDGVVLSSIYSRERTSIFAKPIKKHASEYELTGEERAVIGKE